MSYFLLDKNLNKLKKLSKHKTLYAFDFDGTLSSINKDIHGAQLTERTYNLLNQISLKVPVAIISGRGVQDLKKRISIPNIYLIGNHGLEGLIKWKNKQERAKKISRQWLKKIISYDLDDSITIENKKYSLSIHFRNSNNRKKSIENIKNLIADLSPKPRIVQGKCVFNLIPANSPHKGTAILELKKILKVTNVFYIGDDDTDEDVFRINKKFLLKIRVGKKINTSADYFLYRRSEVNKLLKSILSSI